jgi:hypothetical protein
VTQPDLFGALAAGGQKNLGRRGMGVLFEEVMLDGPRVVPSQTVGEFDLIQRVLENLDL